MYKQHPVFETPENSDTQLWRYIDFTKFVSLLERQALFFARVKHLRHFDAFEGSYSKITLDRAVSPAPNPLLADFDQHVVVNSWHINESESAAMWDLYLKERPGLAICTTFQKLMDSFRTTAVDVLLGKVQYIDHLSEAMPAKILKDGFNGLAAFMCKRRAFAHETELRAITLVQEQAGGVNEFLQNGGLYIPVNLDCLIEEIVVSPNSPPWFRSLVHAVAAKYNLGKSVRTSTMDEFPVDLRATDKAPLRFKCPQCEHEQETFVDASRIQENADGTTVVFYARSVSLNCEKCETNCIVGLNVENKSANPKSDA